MAGLLDSITEDQLLGGLLGAGAASGAKGNFLARMAAGIGAGERFSQGRREEARQRSQDEMRAEYQKLMMLKMQRDAQQQEAAAAQAKAKRNALPGLFGGQQVPGQVSTPTMGGIEMFSQGSTQTPPRTVGAGQLDFMKALKAGFGADEITKLAALPNLGRPEVARTMKGLVNGREVDQQFDKFGQPVGQGMEQFKAPIMVDRGGQTDAVDPYMKPGASFLKTMTPDAKASNALGWANNAATLRGQDMTNARANDGTWSMNNDTGYMVNSRSGEARAAVGPDGKPIGPKMPEATKKELMSINQQRSIINGALNAVTATPDAFSFSRGVTGQLPYGESLAGRMESPSQTQARAYVFNNVSRVINERAGAAQSAQELQRLRSFLPADTDGPEQIKNKLQGFSTYLNDLESGTKGDPVKVGDPNSSNTSSPKKADWVYKNGKLVKAN